MLFINASEYFEKEKRQHYLSDDHTEKIIETYRERPERIDRYARRVEMSEIDSNDYNLNITRCVSTAKPEEIIDLAQVHRDLVRIAQESHDAAAKYNSFLKELGLPPLPTCKPTPGP